MPTIRMKVWYWLVPLFLLVAWLGMRKLDADPIWGDEYYSILDAGGAQLGPLTLEGVAVRVATRNPWHVPGFFMLLNQWGTLTGWDPATLRLLSLLFGLLAIAWTYRLGHDHFGKRVGLGAAAVLGTSVLFVHYLHEVRHYALIACLTAFTLWAYLRLMRLRPASVWLWLGWWLSVVGLLYTHYFAILPLVAVAVVHLAAAFGQWQTRPVVTGHGFWRRWWQLVAGAVVAGLTFVPWLGVLGAGLERAAASEELERRALDNGEVLANTAYLLANGVVPLLLVTLGLALAAWSDRGERRRVGRGFAFALGILVPILLVNAVLPIVPTTRIRYLMSLWIPVALLIALAADWLGRRTRERIGAALLVVWLAAGVVGTLDGSVTRELGGAKHTYPMHTISHLVRGYVLPDDLLLNIMPPDGQYNSRSAAYYYDPFPLRYFFVMTNPDARSALETSSIPAEAVDTAARVWLASVPNASLPPAEAFQASAAAAFAVCQQFARPELNLTLYAREPICCGAAAAPLARFGAGITLDAIAGIERWNGVEPLALTVAWSIAPGVPLHAYSTSLQVLDASGNKVAQADYGLPAQVFACEQSTLDLSTLPAGEYTLGVLVYAWQTGERLSGVDLRTGAASGDLVQVGALHKSQREGE